MRAAGAWSEEPPQVQPDRRRVFTEQPSGDQAKEPPAPRHYEELRWLEGPHGLRVAGIVAEEPQPRAGEGVDNADHRRGGGAQPGSHFFGARRDEPH